MGVDFGLFTFPKETGIESILDSREVQVRGGPEGESKEAEGEAVSTALERTRTRSGSDTIAVANRDYGVLLWGLKSAGLIERACRFEVRGEVDYLGRHTSGGRCA